MIQATQKHLVGLLARVEQQQLEETDWPILVEAIASLIALEHHLLQKRPSVPLARKILAEGPAAVNPDPDAAAGRDPKPSEAGSKPTLDPDQKGSGNADQEQKEQTEKRGKNRGRIKTEAYWGLAQIPVPHPEIKDGDFCICGGSFKSRGEKRIVRIFGQVPLGGAVYCCASFRCNRCLQVATAPLPVQAGPDKYHPSARAMMALLRMGYGMSAYRLEKLQKSMGIPVPDATQWDQVKKVAECLVPIYLVLEKLAANGQRLFVDDTGVRIQSLLAENRKLPEDARKGMHLTGLISEWRGRKIVLYLPGRKHAGENLDTLLKLRDKALPPPLQMNDASVNNVCHSHDTIEANCMSHAGRRFNKIRDQFPEWCDQASLAIRKIYACDEETKERAMNPEQRLAYLRKHARPWVERLKIYLTRLLEEQWVEPNSTFTEAAQYMLKRWEKFTRFLEIPGAPIDNNCTERALKVFVIHRKNSMFFRSRLSAYFGGLLLSMIQTSQLCGANSFDYLVAVQQHAHDVRRNAHLWLPWVYRRRVQELTGAVSPSDHGPVDPPAATLGYTRPSPGARSTTQSGVLEPVNP